MKWLSRLKKPSTSEMPNKQAKKKTVKHFQKEIEMLRDEYRKIELRPCHGDTDLHQRENELEVLKSKIHALEKEQHTVFYTGAYEA